MLHICCQIETHVACTYLQRTDQRQSCSCHYAGPLAAAPVAAETVAPQDWWALRAGAD